jgi:cysteine desulfurase/selenocysteine lyase
MEHHSNLLPWQELSQKKGLIIRYVPIINGTLDMNKFKTLINKNTRVVAVTHVSNVLGTINDIKEIAKLVHRYHAILVVDGAQSVAHFAVDVKKLDCDFFVFSGHKMMGPTGVGVLYGKYALLETLNPVAKGGGMVSQVSFSHATWNEIPARFEAGTPPIAEVIGLGRAVRYLEEIGMDTIYTYEKELTTYALTRLKELRGVEVYGPRKDRSSVISFGVKGIHGHDVATILNHKGVAIRAGHMCAMPLVREILKVNDVCRASLSIYNTSHDIDKMIEGIKEAQKIFQ